MELRALLLSQEQDSCCLLQDVLSGLQIESEVCSERDAALDQLAQNKYDAVLVDCAVEGATDLLKYVRVTGENKNCISLAMVDSLPEMQGALDQGANFVVCKPLSPEAVSRSLKAMRGLIYRLGRRSVRVVVQTLAFVAVDGHKEQGIILDVSEGGMAIQALEPVEASRVLHLRFELPGMKGGAVETTGEIAWADASGRAGVRFLDMPADSRARLKDWVLANVLRPSRITLSGNLVVKDDDPASRDWAANISVSPLLEGEGGHPAIAALHAERTAERVFGSLLDWVIVGAATVVFAVLVFRFTGTFPQSRWALPLGLAVPWLFWVLYQYIFLADPLGTPGAQVARLAAARNAPMPRNRRFVLAWDWVRSAFRDCMGEVQEGILEDTSAEAAAAQRIALGQITINPLR